MSVALVVFLCSYGVFADETVPNAPKSVYVIANSENSSGCIPTGCFVNIRCVEYGNLGYANAASGYTGVTEVLVTGYFNNTTNYDWLIHNADMYVTQTQSSASTVVYVHPVYGDCTPIISPSNRNQIRVFPANQYSFSGTLPSIPINDRPSGVNHQHYNGSNELYSYVVVPERSTMSFSFIIGIGYYGSDTFTLDTLVLPFNTTTQWYCRMKEPKTDTETAGDNNVPNSTGVTDQSGGISDTIDSQHNTESSYFEDTQTAISDTGIQNFSFTPSELGGLNGLKNDFTLVWNACGSLSRYWITSLTIGLALAIIRHRKMFDK